MCWRGDRRALFSSLVVSLLYSKHQRQRANDLLGRSYLNSRTQRLTGALLSNTRSIQAVAFVMIHRMYGGDATTLLNNMFPPPPAERKEPTCHQHLKRELPR